jgi:hypothetical protein
LCSDQGQTNVQQEEEKEEEETPEHLEYLAQKRDRRGTYAPDEGHLRGKCLCFTKDLL